MNTNKIISVGKLQLIIPLIFLALFCYINTYFVDSFYTLSIRKIDDFAFQEVLISRFDSFISFDLRKFIGIADYGYGVLFWLISFFFALPGYLLNSTELVIYGPRLLSTLSIILGSYILSKSIENTIGKQAKIISLLGFIGLIFPKIINAALGFQSRALIFLLISSSLYFLLNKNLDTKKRIQYSLFFEALAIGIHINVLSTLPIYFLICFCILKYEKKINDFEIDFKLIRNNVILFFSTALFSFQPKFILLPFFARECVRSIKVLLYQIFHTAGLGKSNLNEEGNLINYIHNVLSGYLDLYLFIVLIALTILVLLFKYRKRDEITYSQKINLYLSLSALIFFGYLIALIVFTNSGPTHIGNYLIPLSPYLIIGISNLTFVLGEIFNKRANRHIFSFLLMLSLLAVGAKYQSTKITLTQFNTEVETNFLSQIRNDQLSKYNSYSECLKSKFAEKRVLKESISVATHYELPVPCGKIDKTCNLRYIFGDYPNLSSNFNPDFIIFKDKKEFNLFQKNNNLSNFKLDSCNNIYLLVKID